MDVGYQICLSHDPYLQLEHAHTILVVQKLCLPPTFEISPNYDFILEQTKI